MKKFFSILLTIIITLSFAACGSSGENESDNRLSVVATIFPYYDFAKNIAGDNARVDILIPAGTDIHSFEPTAQDIAKIQNCDIFIYNGGESDTWVENIINSLDQENLPDIMKMTDYVEPILEQDAEHNQGDEMDEHIWISPRNASNLMGHIMSQMQKLDAKNSQQYKDNYSAYTQEMYSISQSIESIVSSANKRKIIVGDRFPLIYFTSQYAIDWECAFPGCSSETEPSLDKLSSLEKIIKDEKYKAIIKLANSGNNVAETLAEDTGVKVVTFYDYENVSKKSIDAGETYNTLLAKNSVAIKEALS